MQTQITKYEKCGILDGTKMYPYYMLQITDERGNSTVMRANKYEILALREQLNEILG